MAKSATIGDFLVLMAVGKKTAEEQQGFLVQQCKHQGKRGRAATGFGRAYYAQMPTNSFDGFPGIALIRWATALAAKPFRKIAALGDYDAESAQ